jgi:DNA-binding HxlR family transcriptional regulator
MPKEYNISKLTRFSYSYEHIASLLSVFSQTPACRIMFLLEQNREMEVKTIRRELKDTESFVISKSLTLLKNHNILEKSEKTYVLKNNIFFRELCKATLDVLTALGERPKENRITEADVKAVAELFAGLFFDVVSNTLIHMLIPKARKFNEVSDMFRSAHGYIPASTLRYHLSTRRIKVRDTKIQVFDFSARNYSLSEDGRRIHDIFDSFLKNYENSIEAWIHDMWEQPIRSLTTETVPIADLRDTVHKLLRIFHTSSFIIAFSTEPRGIITTKNLMNKLGGNLGHIGFLSNTTVEEVMTPIDRSQIISGDTTLLKIYKKEDGFPHNHYIVDLGKGNYNVLSIYDVLQKFSVT